MNEIRKTQADELSVLKTRNAELETLEIERNWMEKALRKQEHDLKERIKEINCLYGISRIVEKTDLVNADMEMVTLEIVKLIPPSWQYPKITIAEIVVEGQRVATGNHPKSPWILSSDIIVNGTACGVVSVYYLEERPLCFEGPFLKEERHLLNAISERLGRIFERKNAEDLLGESRKELKKQNRLLDKKNQALKEIMNEIVSEKNLLEKRVLDNVDHLLEPILKRLKSKSSMDGRHYIEQFEESLTQYTSAFSEKTSRNITKLTPRENEICKMIRNGLTSKEIADLLNITYRSVETYRNYIRKKLGLTNQKVNLTTYLINMQKI